MHRHYGGWAQATPSVRYTKSRLYAHTRQTVGEKEAMTNKKNEKTQVDAETRRTKRKGHRNARKEEAQLSAAASRRRAILQNVGVTFFWLHMSHLLSCSCEQLPASLTFSLLIACLFWEQRMEMLVGLREPTSSKQVMFQGVLLILSCTELNQ